MAKEKKQRAKKYDEKVVLKEGTTFADLMKVAVNPSHSLKEEIAKRKVKKD